ncbi:D-alanyl-D-alanine carboxypeptidase/D-alanyl-D-alanine-endopeptidase [Mycobacterium sp. CBMA293]|uniref:D-alanyl-D-alanine carboxypeptidase/D-alanyl-D-alanine endopeptidase n=1 Tax=unclassified Mycolicibacterium TaxID=2636767 RepID=UPI0012DE32C6|nr:MULTISPECIES: D-alanyl-D-alanine carboxypeptidase/D-alanyl-D-alanine-endopeptidase [unclassified Mycolicibacterium]MUL46117.1 D-alanyl-D-alanine carboxypeptidase/D-alanyl-D-alanine-endopeptidase [Mycolicibacterium sp. CBMA 360]MUL58834.1 D-alanyl-D-alanine carboxypeptidase/D-alanyl-D-alanine-endopeptidase [Mycolicibacterium sp. CBMA 335]MUL69228.1 D-alanyl-D-alanine carboxypeptidase/D-alanyl-D-alanine-endopeptidase [Mycolicibacterium sp. CBMA 311]MUL94192.1 D-alanyl-D-alanine carboxypeptidas
MRPTRWRRSTHVLIGVAVLVLVAAVVAAAAVMTRHQAVPAAAPGVKPQPALVTPQPGVQPLSDAAPQPVPAQLAAVLAPLAANPNLGQLGGRITDAVTGIQLWGVGENTPLQPASTNKTLTATAALLTLDRNARLTTTVLTGDTPGVVVLHGGGDPTLSAAPPGTDSWYGDAARISDLADQVRKAGVTPRTIQVDVSAFSGPTMAPGWDVADIEGGDWAPIQSVMIDAGRVQPTTVESKRSTTPALDAGRALASALRIDPANVTVRTTPATGGQQIASVQSPPLIERLREMMSASDNVMAESIGREVAAAVNEPQSFEGGVRAVLGQLGKAGLATSGATLFDASGLSVNDRLTATVLDDVVNAAAGNDQPKLRPLLDVLPIAGGSGTLWDRYADTPSAGYLRAKTGSLTGTNALAGIVTDQSGRVLTFALISNNAGPEGRTALDALAAAFRSCGCGS